MRLDICEKAVSAIINSAPEDMKIGVADIFEKMKENPAACFCAQLQALQEAPVSRAPLLIGMLLGITMAYSSDDPEIIEGLNEAVESLNA